jgi:glycine cleavage system H protein
MLIPENLWYSRTHEWILFIEGRARVGLTDFAQDALGDIVYLSLPESGETIENGGVIGEVESVKAVSEICAPVSGVICAVNGALSEAPETVNSDPYGAWIIEIDSITEKDGLLTPAQYEEFCREEGH